MIQSNPIVMNLSSNGQTLGFKIWLTNIPHINQKLPWKYFCSK
jgi:hypothetical protein